ncbi:MAG: acetyl-CoA carboxylase biotin carboxylase subunit [Candidatus Acidiferrales bacterium]
MFRKILIANRGEIAVRILRGCRELGIRAVTVFSDVDRDALHVRLSDEAYPIGPAPARESYLVIDKILGVARLAGCDALHPGYGFLAENPELARECRKAGVKFIGPSPEAMEQLGSKTAARQVAKRVGAPTVPGTIDPVSGVAEAQPIARDIGFPVLLKAVAGGGGKGMRLVENEREFPSAWRDASSEALNSFGDARLYLEKYLARPRHVEIQVLADEHGHTVYLGERECSVQRRYQKVIEEAPSPIMTTALRQAMGEAAVKIASAGNYTNAGTCEFLVDAARNFYFLEMNTRLQVEHPVTELVTSLDLVKLQIRIAAGEALPFAQSDVSIRGHAMECRIYAEDTDNHFFPSPGKVTARRVPTGPGIRLDEGVYAGWTVPSDYDPLLGKLIAWGADREEAIARLRRALSEYYVNGITTNVALFRRILDEPEFVRGEIYTRWLDDLLQRQPRAADNAAAETVAALAIALWHLNQAGATSESSQIARPPVSRWKLEGRSQLLRQDPHR